MRSASGRSPAGTAVSTSSVDARSPRFSSTPKSVTSARTAAARGGDVGAIGRSALRCQGRDDNVLGRGARDVVATARPDEERARIDPRRVDVAEAIDLRATEATDRCRARAAYEPRRGPSPRRRASSRSGSCDGSTRTDPRRRVVSPQSDLGRELHGRSPRHRASCTPSHAERFATPAPASTASASSATTRSAR